MIEGRLQTRNWVGQDNVKRYVTEIVAESLQLGPRTDGRVSNEGRASDNTNSFDAKKPPVREDNIPIIDANEPINQNFEEDEVKISEKDLPF